MPTEIAFVNNMPDGAFHQTERQFLGLLEAGRGSGDLVIRRYALPGVPRSDEVAQHIGSAYLPLDLLWETAPDAVIVTGSEPLASEISEEPYWSDLCRLIDRSVASSRSVILSCLAAHAALSHLDGLVRTRLPVKCTGVFAHSVCGAGSLTAGLAERLMMPHSRLNEVATDAVQAAGYQVAIGSPEAGWAVVAKLVDNCRLVLIQGHPEYDADSLLREYRRDVHRYLTGARPGVPRLPVGCVAAEDRAQVDAFQARLATSDPDPNRMADLDFEALSQRAPWSWREGSIGLYGNWLAGLPGDSVPPAPGQPSVTEESEMFHEG